MSKQPTVALTKDEILKKWSELHKDTQDLVYVTGEASQWAKAIKRERFRLTMAAKRAGVDLPEMSIEPGSESKATEEVVEGSVVEFSEGDETKLAKVVKRIGTKFCKATKADGKVVTLKIANIKVIKDAAKLRAFKISK